MSSRRYQPDLSLSFIRAVRVVWEGCRVEEYRHGVGLEEEERSIAN